MGAWDFMAWWERPWPNDPGLPLVRPRVIAVQHVMMRNPRKNRKGEPTSESLAMGAVRMVKLDDGEAQYIIDLLRGVDIGFFVGHPHEADERRLRHEIGQVVQSLYRRGEARYNKNARRDSDPMGAF